MIPGVGFIFDGVNAAWYLAEGDWFHAATSFVSALPGVGDAIGVFAKAGKGCKIMGAFHKAGAIGEIALGAYELGGIAEKYLDGSASMSAGEILGDLLNVAMTGASMLGAAKDFGTSYCFVAGTLVATEDGQKPIEEVEVGDKVLSENEMTGEVALKEVYATSVSETDELYHIHVNGEEIVATGTHPFYVYKFGWTTARALRAGDVLVLSNGELVTIEWIDHEILESPIYVYNFEVEVFHTYFVGESGILVHNGKRCTVKNNKGQKYPNVKDLKTGESMAFPKGDLSVVPKENRAPWFGTKSQAKAFRKNNPEYNDAILSKGEFIDEWYKRGYTTPKGGWHLYEIHHIQPRKYGGSSSFDNLTPVLINIHRKIITPWWNSY